MTNKTGTSKKVLRLERELQSVPLGLTRINPAAQGNLNVAWLNQLIATFDVEIMGNMEVNLRGSLYYIMDDQHRIEALKKYLGDGWEAQEAEMWVTSGLCEEQEAEYFLGLNDRRAKPLYQRFLVAVTAGRPMEVDIDRQVRLAGLHIAADKSTPGSVTCPGTIIKIYKKGGPLLLGRVLTIIRNAYGDPGLISRVIDGLGLFCQRYNGAISDESVWKSLSRPKASIRYLDQKAFILREKTGAKKTQCFAAAIVETINGTRRGRIKLDSWWREA